MVLSVPEKTTIKLAMALNKALTIVPDRISLVVVILLLKEDKKRTAAAELKAPKKAVKANPNSLNAPRILFPKIMKTAAPKQPPAETPSKKGSAKGFC